MKGNKMARCTSCGKYFDQDDYMSDEYDGATVCPDCYFGGGVVEDEDELDFDDELVDTSDEYDEEDEDVRTIRQYFGDELDTSDDEEFSDDEFRDEFDDYEDRLDCEEGDYE